MSRDEDELDDEEGKGSRPGTPFDPSRLVRTLVRGKWWLLVAAVLGGVIGILGAKFAIPQTFNATASIRYEGSPSGESSAPGASERELPALTSVAHSEPILRELRDRVPDYAELNMLALRAIVQVETDTSSGVVSFTTGAKSAEEAAAAANTLVEIFLDAHRERRRDELRAEMASLDERIAAANRQLEQERRTYDSFREANAITDLTTEQEAAITRAAELRAQADIAGAEIEALEARVATLRRSLDRTPRTEATSTGEGRESGRLRDLRAQLREARSRFSDEHPQVQALERQIDLLQESGGGAAGPRMQVNRLHDELRSALSAAEAELESTRQRRESLNTTAIAAQERVTRFSAIEGQASNLLAAVTVARALVTDLTERRSRIEDALRDVQTGFRSVAVAQPPEFAERNKKKYLLAAGVPALFIFVMMAMLLTREARGLRLQTASEVAYWGHGPVIGSTTWPRQARALIDLIADMDDHAPQATGEMLVIGATDGEREAAGDIAGQLNHDWSSHTLVDLPALPAGHALPSNAGPSSHASARAMGTDDDPLSGEIYDGPTEIAISTMPGEASIDLYAAPTDIGIHAGAPAAGDSMERLVCTAWTGPSEGQALRRAARLADRVLIVVRADTLKPQDLAQMKTRVGRQQGVGYVLIGISEEVARLPDRAGSVEHFWHATATAT